MESLSVVGTGRRCLQYGVSNNLFFRYEAKVEIEKSSQFTSKVLYL